MNNKLSKAMTTLGDFAQEMEGLSPEALKSLVVQAEKSMAEAKDELEANPNYQRAKEDLAVLSSGMKEVNKRQKAIIVVALSLLGISDAGRAAADEEA